MSSPLNEQQNVIPRICRLAGCPGRCIEPATARPALTALEDLPA